MGKKRDPESAVEQALLQRALGVTVTEVRREVTDKGEKTVTTEKQLPPDISAQLFWLKNRRPERWRDKPEAGSGDSLEPTNLMAVLGQEAAE